MSFDFDTSEDVQGGGGFLSEPGTYHVTITNILDGVGKKGKPLEHGGFTVEADVMSGTVKGCESAKWSETLFAPNGSSEKGDEWAKKKITAFLLAVDLMTPSQLGKPISVELSDAIGRQFLVRLQKEMDFNGETGKYDLPGKYLEIAFANIYHVDDPEVKDIPKNGDAIGLIPKEHRHDASWFAFKEKKAGKTSQKQPAAAATSVAGGFDDLMD